MNLRSQMVNSKLILPLCLLAFVTLYHLGTALPQGNIGSKTRGEWSETKEADEYVRFMVESYERDIMDLLRYDFKGGEFSGLKALSYRSKPKEDGLSFIVKIKLSITLDRVRKTEFILAKIYQPIPYVMVRCEVENVKLWSEDKGPTPF